MGTLNMACLCRLLFERNLRRQLTPGSNSGMGSQFVSYHCTGALLWPKDSGIKPVERRQRSGVSKKPIVSDGWQERGQSGRSGAPNKTWRRDAAVTWEQKPQGDSRMSSELMKLSLEDFSDDELEKPIREKIKKDPKEERNYEMVFGASPCLLALTQGRRKAHRLFVKEGEASHRASVLKVCEEAHRRGVQIQRVSKKELERLSAGRVHQGLCLQASPLGYLTEEDGAPVRRRESSGTPLWLVLDGIQDPMNLGAILRSAYFLGVDRVASSLHSSCPLTPVVSKASSGVMEVMGVYGYKSLEDLLDVKVAQGWQAVGTVGAEVADSQIPVVRCSDFLMTKPTLLLMGGEGAGLSLELLRRCETLLTIPSRGDLHPGIESLNVSVATGILLHSLLSSRRGGK